MYDHRTIERGLDLLQAAVSKLEKKEKVSTEVFEKLIRFFREFADKYDPSPPLRAGFRTSGSRVSEISIMIF
jgi:sulfur relay (sulfurtransferase) DsrC/TusE family protein